MGHKTANQRLAAAQRVAEQEQQRQLLAAMAEKGVREAAAEAWAEQVEVIRREVTERLKATLGLTAQSFPAPLKGRLVIVEVDGFMFAQIFDRQDRLVLALVVPCPICDEPAVYTVRDYADLGRLIANAEVDPRCSSCVYENRLVSG